jgi:parvulin-like peptidyl-prolyl isomerase
MSLVAAFLAAAVAAAPADAPAQPQGRVIERIAAVVNDGVVLMSEVDSVLEDMMRAQPPAPGTDVARYRAERRKEILDTLIAEKLLEQEVKKLHVDVTDQEVQRVVEATKQEHGLDDAKLKQALAQQGLTLDEYKEGLKKQLTKMKIVQLKVKSRVTITDDDVKTMAKQTKAQQDAASKGVVRVRARHILFLVTPGQSGDAERAKALEIKQKLDAGADFAETARAVSDDKASAQRGGDLGEFGRGEMVPEFEEAAFAAEPGKVVGPIRSPFGWHLIKVEERIQGNSKAQGGATDGELENLRQRLYESEVEQAFLRYIDELKKDAYIDVRL